MYDIILWLYEIIFLLNMFIFAIVIISLIRFKKLEKEVKILLSVFHCVL